MQNNNRQELQTLRDLIRYAVSRLNAARVALGHGSDNAWDEAVSPGAARPASAARYA